MIGLQYAEERMMICEAVSIQYRNVIDRQTDGRTDRRTDKMAISISRVSVSIAVLMRDKNVLTAMVNSSLTVS